MEMVKNTIDLMTMKRIYTLILAVLCGITLSAQVTKFTIAETQGKLAPQLV